MNNNKRYLSFTILSSSSVSLMKTYTDADSYCEERHVITIYNLKSSKWQMATILKIGFLVIPLQHIVHSNLLQIFSVSHKQSHL